MSTPTPLALFCALLLCADVDAAPAEGRDLRASLASALEVRRRGDLQGALKTLRAILARAPSREARFELAVTLSWAGKLEAALRQAETLLRAEPEHGAAKELRDRLCHWLALRRAAALREHGDLLAATRAFEAIVARKPEAQDARLELATTLAWRKRYDEALRHFDRVLRADPKHVGALAGRARTQRWAGHASATESYRSAIVAAPGDLALRRELARFQARPRWTLRLEGSYGAVNEGPRQLAGGAALSYAGFEPWGISLGYRRVGPDPLGGGNAGAQSEPWQQLEAGVSHSRPKVSLAAGYELQLTAGDDLHRLRLAASWRPLERLVLSGELRPGLTSGAQSSLATITGVALVGSRWELGATFFGTLAPGQNTAAGLARGRLRLWSWLDLGAGAGGGESEAGGTFSTLSAQLDLRLSEQITFTLSGERFAGPFQRLSLGLGLGLRL